LARNGYEIVNRADLCANGVNNRGPDAILAPGAGPSVRAATEPLRGDSREDFGRSSHSFGVTRRADRIAMAKRVGYPLTSYNLKMDRSS